MTMLGTESFNGPLNQADLNAKGYWAGANTVTGAGVPYGNPFQYRSLMRPGSNAVATFPFSGSSGFDSQPAVINLGLARDLYAAGGFYVGVTANYLTDNPNWISSDGTKVVGVGSFITLGFNTSDYVDWQSVTNTTSGFSATTVRTPLRYIGGSYYCALQGSDSSFSWAVASDIPGNFAITQLQGSSTAFMNSLTDFTVMSVGGTAYYAGGYISSPSVSSRIVRSVTGATNSWSAVYTGTGTGQVWFFHELGGAMYTTEYSTIGGNARGQVLRSTDGTTWAAVHTASVNGASTCQRMAYDGNQTLVVVGAGGYIASSVDNGVTWAARTSGTTDGIKAIVWTGSEFAAVTSTYATLRSTDGLSWTYVARNLTGITTQDFYVVYSGSETLVYSSGGAGFGFRWNPTTKLWDLFRAINSTYNNNASSTPPTGAYFGTPTGGTNATIAGGMSMAGFSLLSDGLWAVGATGSFNWGTKLYQFNTTPAANTSSPKRLELEYIAVPNQSVPTFDVYWYVDGIRAPNPLRMAGSASGYQSILFSFAALGHNQWYDFVYGDHRGTRNNMPMGNVRLLKKQNTTDTQAQWDRLPAELTSNATAAQGNGSWTQSSSSIQSSTVGQIDQYSGGMPALPPGYRVAAITLGAAAQRVGLTTPTVRMGLIDGGAALPQVAAVLTGNAVAPLRTVYETNSSGSGWSLAQATDALVSIENQEFGPGDDPYWAAVTLLAKFNGVAGSSVFVNSAGSKTAMRRVTNAVQSAGQSKFYPTSLDLTAPLSGVQFDLNPYWIWGSRDYTIECWIYPTTSTDGVIFYPSEIGNGNFFYFTRLAAGTVRMLGYRNGSQSIIGTTTNTVATNAWSHFAVTRQSGTVRMFINGVLGATLNDVFQYVAQPAATGYIGVQNTSGSGSMTGYMSEFRVTMDVARYTANFTPPTAALPDH